MSHNLTNEDSGIWTHSVDWLPVDGSKPPLSQPKIAAYPQILEFRLLTYADRLVQALTVQQPTNYSRYLVNLLFV